MLTKLFEDARFYPISNLHTCILLVEVYRFGQCFVWRFPPVSTFFSLLSSSAFRDASHLRLMCGDPNQCLPNFSKMRLLAFPQTYTRVFHLWKSIDLGSVWVGDSRQYQLFSLSLSLVSSCAFRDAPHSRFRRGNRNQCL